MVNHFFSDQSFRHQNYKETSLVKGEYMNCTFQHCNFENAHVINIQFIECEFIDCNFSNAILKDTAFKEVAFRHCKMIGVPFHTCDPFLLKLSFESSSIDVSSFYQLNLTSTVFTNCSLEETDFTEAILKGSEFTNCNLRAAVFDRTNLENVDLTTAVQFEIDPEKNRVKGAKFSKENAAGLLLKHKIIVV